MQYCKEKYYVIQIWKILFIFSDLSYSILFFEC